MENSQTPETATPESTTPETPVLDSKQSPPEAAPQTAAKKEQAIINKIKVGDLEFDETTLQQMIKKAEGADKKFLEAAKARQEAIKFFKRAKTNPEEFLSRAGHDPKKWAFDMVAKEVQDNLRDPKEVALEAAQKRLEEFERKEAEAKAKSEADRLDQETKAMEQKFHAEIIEALDSAPTLPKNGFTVAKIAKYIDTVRNKTGHLLSAKEVVHVVEKDILSEVRGMLSGADAEKIISLIGEEGMSAIRKYDIAKLKNPLKQEGQVKLTEQQKSDKKKQSSKDFWKSIKTNYKAEKGEI